MKKFDSDTDALIAREKLNRDAVYDLEDWIFSQVNLKNKRRILDLGCGTGKQVFALAKRVSPEVYISGIDISQDAVLKVNERIQKENIANAKAFECSLDGVFDFFKGQKFDLIVSTYAIYYSKDMVKLLSSLPSILNSEGEVFICGYGDGSNKEIHELINNTTYEGSKSESTGDFISKVNIEKIGSHYNSFQTMVLSNKVNFHSVADVMNWWENHNSYVPSIRTSIADQLEKHFEKNDIFSLSKNVLGLRYDI